MYKETLVFNGYSPKYQDWLDFFIYLNENHILNDFHIDLLIYLYCFGYFTITKREIHLHDYHPILSFSRLLGYKFMEYYQIDEDIMNELLLFDIYQDFDDNQVFILKDEIINVIDDLYPKAKAIKDNIVLDQVRKEELLCIKEFLSDKKIDRLLEVRKYYIEINYNENDFN